VRMECSLAEQIWQILVLYQLVLLLIFFHRSVAEPNIWLFCGGIVSLSW
jgi:hypothetical protein